MKSLQLRLMVNNLSHTKWFVDAAHTVHNDCRGQRGAGMILREGAVISFLWKQKCNNKSYMETELIGVNDVTSTIILGMN